MPGTKVLPLKMFRSEIANSLLKVGKSRCGRPSTSENRVSRVLYPITPRPYQAVRMDTVGH